MENANFNFELLSSDENSSSVPVVFNVNDNSSQADFAPSFYSDQLLFTSARSLNTKRKYDPSGESFLDIFVARLNTKGDIVATRPFNGIPNFEFHQGTPYFSDALDAVFYIRSNEENGDLVFDDKGKNSLALGSSDRNGNFRFLLKDLSTSFYYPFYDADKWEALFCG